MRLGKLLSSMLAASSICVLPAAQAGIVSTSGSVTQITAPASVVQNGSLESNTAAYLFAEQQNVLLTQAAALNATTPGLFDAAADLTPGSIGIGSLVSSYYLHADPLGSGGVVYRYSGSFTFDTDILGVAALGTEILGTSFLGAPGTTYGLNGVEFGGNGWDRFSISADRRTLSFNFEAWPGATPCG